MKDKCPLCEAEDSRCNLNENPWRYSIACPACGDFALEEDLVDQSFPNKAKVAIIAKLRKLYGQDRYFLYEASEHHSNDIPSSAFAPITIDNFIREFPVGADIFDKSLNNLALQWPDVHMRMDFQSIPSFSAHAHLFYCSRGEDAQQIFRMLVEMGYISEDVSSNYISAEGWKRLQLLGEHLSSTTAFVAMWFDERTKLFRESVKSAVEQAGYSASEILADETHHNDYIMDKVINMIDESRFVIADFTCAPEAVDADTVKGGARGGVYFEAGYARGKSKQVIHTCSNDGESAKRRHFDVDQINTIFWQEEAGVLKSWGHDFIDVLAQRIIATVGKGPLVT